MLEATKFEEKPSWTSESDIIIITFRSPGRLLFELSGLQHCFAAQPVTNLLSLVTDRIEHYLFVPYCVIPNSHIKLKQRDNVQSYL